MKKKILSIACVLVSAITFAQIPTDGLVGYYPFNGNANDESTNSNDGTVNGATLTTDRFGNANSAYSFDGVDDYIQLSPFSGTTGSINVWAKLETYTTERVIFSQMDTTTSVGNRIQLMVVDESNPTTPKAFLWNHDTRDCNSSGSNGGNLINTISSDSIKSEQWYMYTVTTDGSTTSLYQNGQLISLTNTTSNVHGKWFDDLCSNVNSARIGSFKRSNVETYFHGSIDDFRIYDSALSQSQITDLFNEGICKVSVTDTLVISLSSIITMVYDPSQAVTTVKVYPNPTDENLTVSIDNYTNLSGVTLKVINSQSAEVHSEAVTGPTQSIDVSSWSAGIYFLQVLNGTDIVDIRKIVVNN